MFGDSFVEIRTYPVSIHPGPGILGRIVAVTERTS